MLILGFDEVRELTGYQIPSKQREALDRAGIRYVVGRDGYPRIPRDWLAQSQQHYPGRRKEPNFGALNGKTT
ncbi:DUF4224 domain-containing protein [Halorhodospira neutriphila]|uniref:DUF4224 domain-containing protein n=1 Tax=Halorhodospira neutriphila TaxID=168379 RepID=UPI00190597E7